MNKKEIEIRYNDFINQLENALSSFSKINGANDQIEDYKKALSSQIKDLIKQSKDEAQIVFNKIPWDRLVIAFFGETNAGKSTVIETARIMFEPNHKPGNDGLIVGDGQGDFTKEYNHYEMVIKGRPFTMIDVPGIEGNEKEYTDGIKEALKYAHLVFYIQDGGKKPDEAVAGNIKKYLSDWVDVYVVQNVRGGASNYDMDIDRIGLTKGKQGEKVLAVKGQIHDIFKRLLGISYKEVVTIQGLLALCAKASFSPKREKDLGKTQSKLISYFGNKENIFSFSNYGDIISLVEGKSSDFVEEITKSSLKKLSALAHRAKSNVELVLKIHEDNIADLEGRLYQYNRDVIQICSETKWKLKNIIQDKVRKEFSEFKQDVFTYISEDNDSIEDEIENRSSRMENSLKTFFKKSISEILKDMEERLKNKQKNLKGIKFKNQNTLNFNNLNIDIDGGGVECELSFNLDDFGDYAISTTSLAATGALIGSLIPGIGTLIGAGVGGALGFVGKLVFGSNKNSKMAKAREEASAVIETAKNKTLNALNEPINRLCRDIDKSKESMSRDIKLEIEKINMLKMLNIDFRNKMSQIIIYNN